MYKVRLIRGKFHVQRRVLGLVWMTVNKPSPIGENLFVFQSLRGAKAGVRYLEACNVRDRARVWI